MPNMEYSRYEYEKKGTLYLVLETKCPDPTAETLSDLCEAVMTDFPDITSKQIRFGENLAGRPAETVFAYFQPQTGWDTRDYRVPIAA